MPIVEFVDAPEPEGELAGRYPVVVEKAGSSNRGGFWTLFKITKGVDRKGQDATGRTIITNVTTDFSQVDPQWKQMHARKMYNFFEAFEVDPKGEFEIEELVGKECEVLVRSYKSKKDGSDQVDISKFFKA